VRLLHQLHALVPQCRRHRRSIVRLQVEVEVLAPFDELDGRIALIDELEVKDMAARADACIEVLVLERQRQPHGGRVEAD
jgi:hypothetical protein